MGKRAASIADYLDARGAHPNFLTGQPHSTAYRELAASKWSKLPVYSNSTKVKEILTSLADNSVTVVISATGSGKSVIIPRLAMKYLMTREHTTPPRLGMTFPKSVLAKESAKYASQTWDVVLGEHVGYQYRGAPPSSHGSDTQALFMTDGTLFTMSRRDPQFKQFDLVIIDEAHERSVQTDFLIERLREALLARPELRLIIMSATIDPSVFTNYFSKSAVVTVAGMPVFEIKHHWELQSVSPESFMATALQRAGEALKEALQAGVKTKLVTDVLVFVPTTKDATKGCKLLKDSKLPVKGTTLCEGLYRKLPEALKDVVIHGRPVAPMLSKLVFATPIAESSITLSSLAAVVDSGLQLSSTWLPLEQATRVTRDMTSKAQISQRVGRVGRVAPGDAYHVYSEAQYKALKDFPDPAILHTDLTEHFLAELCRPTALISTVLKDCSQLITPPTQDHTRSVVNTLQQLGLLNRQTGSITDLGRNTQKLCEMFRMSLAGSLILLGGCLVDCREDALILACILDEAKGEMNDLWSLTIASTGDARTPLRAYCDELSDHLSLVNIYRGVYMPIAGSRSWNRSRSRGRGMNKGEPASALHIAVWDRIHSRIVNGQSRYKHFEARVDTKAEVFKAVAPPSAATHPSFKTPLLRAIAFARRHRQLVFSRGKVGGKGKDMVSKDKSKSKSKSKSKKEGDSSMASSAGPLTSSLCSARTLLATNVTRPKSCVGGLYDELVEVGGKRSFSVISWVC